MIDRFPSFAGLKAFYAVAATGGVVKAAERLGISPSAVSHQIKKFEGELGVRLFDHNKGKRRLTADGLRYFQAVEQPLRQILEATEGVRSTPGQRKASITLTPSLAVNWLMPKLRQFNLQHPDIELNLVTTTRVVDLVRENVDLAIRRGTSNWPGLKSELLMSEMLVPVMSPDQWQKVCGLEPLDIFSQTKALVNTAVINEWEEWCRNADIASPTPSRQFKLGTYELAVQAAVDGLGIALGRRPMVDGLLDSGELVAPLTGLANLEVNYYVLWPQERSLTTSVRTILDWLLSHKI
ncbi:MAG: LysR substrate-binding domain-containing protein [Stappiaceae bacterium]